MRADALNYGRFEQKPVFERLLAHRTDYARLSKAKEARELEGCTFAPDISLSKENSDLAVEATRRTKQHKGGIGSLLAGVDGESEQLSHLGDGDSIMTSPQGSSIFERLRAEAEERKEREVLRERMRVEIEKVRARRIKHLSLHEK